MLNEISQSQKDHVFYCFQSKEFSLENKVINVEGYWGSELRTLGGVEGLEKEVCVNVPILYYICVCKHHNRRHTSYS